jgi:Domain of unknown function (DUF397)
MAEHEARARSQLSEQGWRRPRRCASGECPEIGICDGMVVIRSSEAPHVVVRLTPGEWADLVVGIRAGEFDDVTA